METSLEIRHSRNAAGTVHTLSYGSKSVSIRYRVHPRFDDQVQGDLIRRYHSQYPGELPPVGKLPVHVDKEN